MTIFIIAARCILTAFIRLITDNAVMMEFHAVILLDILLTLYRFIPVRVINTDPARQGSYQGRRYSDIHHQL